MKKVIKNKHLIVVRALPYEAGGTPVAIRSLLRFLSGQDFIVLGRRVHPKKRLTKDEVAQKMYSIPILYTKGHRFWKYFSILPGLLIGVYLLRKYKVKSIITVFQDDASLILGLLLAKFLPGIPFYPYFMDLYADQKTGRKKRFALWMQELVFKRADKVLVANAGMEAFFKQKYETPVVAIPIISKTVDLPDIAAETSNKPFTITYSGSINEDRLEPIQKLVALLKEDQRFRLKFLTPNDITFFKAYQLYDEQFIYKYCRNTEELFRELNTSDLLYLPLRFTFPKARRDQLTTCFGAKTYDYLQCKVPILMHAPSYFFNYQVLEKNNAAFCLDSLEEDQIKSFLAFCLSDQFEREAEMKAEHANVLARQFQGDRIADLFLQQIEISED